MKLSFRADMMEHDEDRRKELLKDLRRVAAKCSNFGNLILREVIIPLTNTSTIERMGQSQTERTPDLWDTIGAGLSVLWKDWPALELAHVDISGFRLRGDCPHCRTRAAFPPVTSSFTQEGSFGHERMIAALRCEACGEYIVGIIKEQIDKWDAHGRPCHAVWVYERHYPIGKPNDSVPEEVPKQIGADFQEALRCRYVDAYNATVEMCRRAVQSSCEHLKADGNNLLEQIDDLATKNTITEPLRDMAHKIRLGGNRAAHPPGGIQADEADAVIEFTKHYFEHVYVMPSRMAKFDFSKKKPKT